MSRDDDLLAKAIKSVRETYDGHQDEADLTLQRALFKIRGEARTRKFARFSILPVAAALFVSTAWAAATGHLGKTMYELLRSEGGSEDVTPAPAGAVHGGAPVGGEASAALAPPKVASMAPPAVAVPAIAPFAPAASKPEPSLAHAPVAPSTVAASTAVSAPPPSPVGPSTVATSTAMRAPPPSPVRPSTVVTSTAASAPPPSPVGPPPVPSTPSPPESAPDPNAALFAEAHRLHFRDRDPARALAAWDAYLAAAPGGPLAPEAHYNRALALVRVGRKAEAMTELAAFANGSYRGYRQSEARKLLDALQSH